jgi:hypothetical protein
MYQYFFYNVTMDCFTRLKFCCGRVLQYNNWSQLNLWAKILGIGLLGLSAKNHLLEKISQAAKIKHKQSIYL